MGTPPDSHIPGAATGGRIHTGSIKIQGRIALMPHNKLGLNQPGSFRGEEVFREMVTHGRTDSRPDTGPKN